MPRLRSSDTGAGVSSAGIAVPTDQLGRGRCARTRPGPGNALGLIKLRIPSRYDVHLHDTPAPALFAEPRRDFSHGCIRVADPAGLAAWVLRDVPG